MSNFLAVATVTATLSQLLAQQVGQDVPGATVTLARPESNAATQAPSVNIFLFRTTTNAAWQNLDLPTRSVNGTLQSRPHVALNLHYLLTFHGDEAQLEPQRMLGSVVRTLHEQPVLTRRMIAAAVANPTFVPFLASSDLALQPEPVRITPEVLSLEEIAKLWSVFFQVPYALSIAYVCSVVIVESELSAQTAPPVRLPAIVAQPLTAPRIAGVAPAIVTTGSRLIVSGANFDTQRSSVDFAGLRVQPDTVTADRLSVALPVALAAGAFALRVVSAVRPDPATSTTVEYVSEPVALELHPTLSDPAFRAVKKTAADTRHATFTCRVDPPVGAAQTVLLLLDEQSRSAVAAFTIAVPARAAATPDLSIACTGLRPGTYAPRLTVDGTASITAAGTAPLVLA